MYLRQFLQKMSIYAHDDFLLMHLFPDSLTSMTCQSFQHLDAHQYFTFKDLAMAFMNHYSINMKLAPTVSDLRRMTKSGHETIWQFALRFRNEGLIRHPLKE